MGVRFILGRSGCGKTEYMLNEIKAKSCLQKRKISNNNTDSRAVHIRNGKTSK